MSATLAQKKEELERLYKEYSRHLTMAHETFLEITHELESCKELGVPGMQLVLNIMSAVCPARE